MHMYIKFDTFFNSEVSEALHIPTLKSDLSFYILFKQI